MRILGRRAPRCVDVDPVPVADRRDRRAGRQDDRLRFIVHFIRLRDQVHLSARRFVREADDVRSFEADVLAEVDRVLRTYLPGA